MLCSYHRRKSSLLGKRFFFFFSMRYTSDYKTSVESKNNPFFGTTRISSKYQAAELASKGNARYDLCFYAILGENVTLETRFVIKTQRSVTKLL